MQVYSHYFVAYPCTHAACFHINLISLVLTDLILDVLLYEDIENVSIGFQL